MQGKSFELSPAAEPLFHNFSTCNLLTRTKPSVRSAIIVAEVAVVADRSISRFRPFGHVAIYRTLIRRHFAVVGGSQARTHQQC